MRIVLAIPRYPGDDGFMFGGTTRMFWLLARALAARDHRVVVLTSDLARPGRRVESDLGSARDRIEVRRSRVFSPWLATHAATLFLLAPELRGSLRLAVRTADVVHMGEARGIHNLWTTEICETVRAPLVWSAFGGLSEGWGLRAAYYAARDALYTRPIVGRVSGFVAQTDHEAGVYLQYQAPENRIHNIPLCFDPPEFVDLPPRGGFRRRFQIPDGVPLVLTVARLHPNKGLELLIEAIAKMGAHSRPQLAVVGWDQGDGDRLARLASGLGIRSRVHFCGALFGSDLRSAYVDSDVFALAPRVHEETSLASLEAAACGLPPLLTPTASIPGLSGIDARLEVRRTLGELSASLNWLLSDPDERATVAARVKDFVWSSFTVDQVVAQHEALYRKVAT